MRFQRLWILFFIFSGSEIERWNCPLFSQPKGKDIYSIQVYKKKRSLELILNKKVIKVYKIGLGFTPAGDKEKEGDGKTPEGAYKIGLKNPHSLFYKAFLINYPNAKDAARGLKLKQINQWQYKAIMQAHKYGQIPPQKTPLGGEIEIHGRGSHRDWTWGCVALDDKDIDELWKILTIGTEVFINP